MAGPSAFIKTCRMHDTIHIDPANGEIELADFRITPETRVEALPGRFAVGPVRQTSVCGEEVPCQFATMATLDAATPVTVSLRFERGVLVGVFFQLEQAVSYDDIDMVERRHRRWMTRKLGQDPGGLTDYPWGSAGVAQDKSGGVHVFLHNRNNIWAR